jgi:malonyl-CoA/methylmalonyl-CoA synthetase
MSDNLFELFRSRFPPDLSKPFLETPEGRLVAYGELEAATARLADLLAARGVAKGDRVAAIVEKSPEAIFLYLATLRAGGVYLPLNTAYTKAEVGYFLGDAEPKITVCRPEAEAALAPIVAATGGQVLTLGQAGEGSLIAASRKLPADFEPVSAASDDVAALLYTSGTTGRAKGAMMSHGNLASNALALHRIWGFEAEDVLLHALPIFHTHGLFVAINCLLLNGTKMLFLPRFDAGEVIGLLPRATVMMGVPTFYTRLLARPDFDAGVCRNMRLFISGSAPLLEETFRDFNERTGHTILERYGMTETGMNTSNPLKGERRAGTVGFPLPQVEVRVTGKDGEVLGPGKVGVLELRGPNVFKGYWRRPEQTAEEFRADGFFVTGDISRRLQRLPQGGRAGGRRARGRRGIRRHRPRPPRLRRGGRRRGQTRARRRRAGRRRSDPGRQGRAGQLQGAKARVLRRRAAPQRHGQSPEERTEGALQGQLHRRAVSQEKMGSEPLVPG